MRGFINLSGLLIMSVVVFSVLRDRFVPPVKPRRPVVSNPNELTAQDRSFLIQQFATNVETAFTSALKSANDNEDLRMRFPAFYKALYKARSVNERNVAELYIPHLNARELYRVKAIGPAELATYIHEFEERESSGLLKPYVEAVQEYQELVIEYYNEMVWDDEQIEVTDG